jgi:hypothetical protein
VNARDHHTSVWFPEPSRIDDTYAWRGEDTTDWLGRSTVPRARECRRFLNENFSKLPGEYQTVLHHALHNRWPSAFFELIVARTLQVLGADIEVEPESEAGTRIDFLAHFPDSTVSVEAVAPVFDADAGETAKRRSSLLDIVESLAPPSWRIMVVELPDLGPSDSPGVSSRSRLRSCSIPSLQRSRLNRWTYSQSCPAVRCTSGCCQSVL